MVLIVVAFTAAVYMGVQHPYERPTGQLAGPLRSTLVPLAPRGAVPGGAAKDLYANSPAKTFRIGADGVTLPDTKSTPHFSESQVTDALVTAKEFLVHSALDPDTLAGGDARAVRLLLDPEQIGQFDESLARPSDDGRHAATGWVMRFDPQRVSLAEEPVRVQGRLAVTEVSASALEVVADHTYVYAVRRAAKKADGAKGATNAESTGAEAGERGAASAAEGPRDSGAAKGAQGARTGADASGASEGSVSGDSRDLVGPVAVPGTGPHSLFTVRREARFRFDRDDLRDHHVEVLESALQAGPQGCAADAAAYLRPLFAGQSAPSDTSAGTNPYATGRPTDSLCGVLAPNAQPSGLSRR